MARGTTCGATNGPRGTICGAMDGLGRLSVAAVRSPGRPLIGGTIQSMTVTTKWVCNTVCSVQSD